MRMLGCNGRRMLRALPHRPSLRRLPCTCGPRAESGDTPYPRSGQRPREPRRVCAGSGRAYPLYGLRAGVRRRGG